MPKILHVADLHETDRAEDEYRWDIFPWMRRRLLNEKCTHWTILGDLTELFDRHAARLIHRLTREIMSLAAIVPGYILKGNHDYTDPDEPFFQFLDHLPNVRFISKPTALDIDGLRVAAIPHIREIDHEARQQIAAVGKDARMVWCHQTFNGSRSEAGGKLEGMNLERFIGRFPKAKTFLAGDVHTPQKIGEMIYVGAPHPVDFGDNFKPRVAITTGLDVSFIERTTLKKSTLFADSTKTRPSTLLADHDEGDRVKITVDLSRADLYRWDTIQSKYKAYCKKKGIELANIQPRVVTSARTDKRSKASRAMTNPIRVLGAYARTRKDISTASLRYGIKLLKIAKKRRR